MIDKRIVWESPDGNISITTLASENRRAGESEEDWIERGAVQTLKKTAMPEGTVRLPDCLKDELPSRRFRNCWRNDGAGKTHVDMPLARVQRMDEIRKERNKLLIAADGPTAREMEQDGPSKQLWVDYKQALRDIPDSTNLSRITTPDNLDSFEPTWPDEPRG